MSLWFDFSGVPLDIREAVTVFGAEFLSDIETTQTNLYASSLPVAGQDLLEITTVLKEGAVTTLDGINPVSYYVTYVTAENIESNPSAKTTAIERDGLAFDVDLSAIPVSPDARVTQRNIYRIGGNLSRATLVGTISDNTTTVFTDTTPDADAGNVQISFSRDRPPAGLFALTVNKQRLIAANESEVYVSSLARPDYFPLEFSDPNIDGARFKMPDPSDPIVALGSTGSATLIGTRRAMYILQGQDADQMSINKIAEVGIIAARTLVMCRSTALWLAPDGMVWSVGSGEPEPVGKKIERTLDAIPRALLSGACAAYHRDRYILCVPGAGSGDPPIVLALDFRSGEWVDLSHVSMAATQMLAASDGAGDLDELLIATAAGYRTAAAAATFSGIVSVLADGTTATLPVELRSAAVMPNGSAWRTRVDNVLVRGRCTAKATEFVYLTVHAGSVSRSYALSDNTTESSVLLRRRVDPALSGRDVWWEITGNASLFELEQVSIAVTRKDRLLN